MLYSFFYIDFYVMATEEAEEPLSANRAMYVAREAVNFVTEITH